MKKILVVLLTVLFFPVTSQAGDKVEMLNLKYSSIDDSVLQVIIPTLVNEINADIRDMDLIDRKYICDIRYHNAFFFAPKNEEKGFIALEKLDSAYLTEKFQGYFDDCDDDFLYYLISKEYGSAFLLFHYGRFSRQDDEIEINIVSKASFNEFKFGLFRDNKYFGNIIVNPYFDVSVMPSNAHILVSRLGVKRFFAIFVLLHEVSHYIEFLSFWKNNPDRFGEKVPSCYLSSERKINANAFRLLNKYWNSIEFVAKR